MKMQKKTARPAFMVMCLLMACATGYSQGQRTVTRTVYGNPQKVQDAYSRNNPMADDNNAARDSMQRANNPQQPLPRTTAKRQTDADQPNVGGLDRDAEHPYKKSVADARKLLQQSIRQLEMATTPEQVDDILRRQPGGADPMTFKALKEASLPILQIYNPEVYNQQVAKNTAKREPTAHGRVSPETRALAETKVSPKLEVVHDSQKSADVNVSAKDERTPLITDSQQSQDIGGWPQLKINSIAKGSGRKIAMINGKFVGVGDEVNGAIVTEINDYSVKMKKGLETKEFQVGK